MCVVSEWHVASHSHSQSCQVYVCVCLSAHEHIWLVQTNRRKCFRPKHTVNKRLFSPLPVDGRLARTGRVSMVSGVSKSNKPWTKNTTNTQSVSRSKSTRMHTGMALRSHLYTHLTHPRAMHGSRLSPHDSEFVCQHPSIQTQTPTDAASPFPPQHAGCITVSVTC